MKQAICHFADKSKSLAKIQAPEPNKTNTEAVIGLKYADEKSV